MFGVVGVCLIGVLIVGRTGVHGDGCIQDPRGVETGDVYLVLAYQEVAKPTSTIMSSQTSESWVLIHLVLCEVECTDGKMLGSPSLPSIF